MTRRLTFRTVGTVAVLAAAIPRGAAAQTVKGRVIEDRVAVGIPDASVRLISERTHVVDSARADSTGSFVFPRRIAPGRYRVTVRRLGFYATAVDGVVVTESGPPAELLVAMRRVMLDTARVTASRYERSLGMDPRALSIKPIDRDEIEKALDRSADLKSLLRNHHITGLWVNERTGCIRIRGGACALVVIDGLPRRDALPDVNLATVDRVLILRPDEADVFFGRRAAGGAIIIYSVSGTSNR
jgi:hypothetical protein